jgi:hypothetical protein
MMAYPGQTQTALGKLYAALWDFQSQPDVIQAGFELGTVVTPLALRCSALDHCATPERVSPFHPIFIGRSLCLGCHMTWI